MKDSLDMNAAVYAKTPLGQQEIQSRSLGLSPLVRRTLVLIDGQRTGKDLAAFAAGADIAAILAELLEKGCVEVKAVVAKVAASATAASAEAEAKAAESAAAAVSSLAALPPASERSVNENDMARNFMINTVNTVFGQGYRLSLIETIARAEGTDGLRMAYLSWLEAMEGNRVGVKRLPELKEKLFKVL